MDKITFFLLCNIVLCLTLSTGILFDELSSNLSQTFLLNVRTHQENQQDGVIPGSHNLPLPDIEDIVSLDSSAFFDKHNFTQPEKDSPMVIYCRSGKRAKKAYDFLVAHNFSKLRIYEGSFLDWQAKGGQIDYPKKRVWKSEL